MTVSHDPTSPAAAKPSRSTGFVFLITVTVHAWIVLVFLFVMAAVEGAQVVGANIGAGLWMLAVSGIGLPWSLIYLFGVWPTHGGDPAGIAFLACCAVFNLVIHATVAAAVAVVRLRRAQRT